MALREISIWKSIDWYTIGLYTVLVFIGWVSIYAASYNFDDASIFDFSERSGKQLLWIGLSFGIAFVLTVPSNFFKACLLILLPMALIMMQKETGSALVYASLIFMLYREGMTGLILFAGLCSIVYFVVGVKYSDMLWGSTPVGEVLVLVGIGFRNLLSTVCFRNIF